MVHQGRKVLDERIDRIRRQYNPRHIQLEPLDPDANLEPVRALPEVEHVDRVNGSYDILLVEGTNPALAMRRIVDIVTPAVMELSRPQLEDVFIKLVSDGADSLEAREKMRADLKDDPAKAAAV
jgi:ABC-type uncharacterized transport system ATPase subunit